MNPKDSKTSQARGVTSRREFLDRSAALVAGVPAAAGSYASARVAPQSEAPATTFGPPVWPPFERVGALLRSWARKHAGLARLDTLGRSSQGRSLYALRVTDSSAGDGDKEHVLLTALHAGLERTGSTTVLAVLEWLLSGHPVARQILRRQIIVGLPIPDPDNYTDGKWSSVYSAWTLDGPRDPEKSPESVAVQKVMDEYQPEVHADVHGLSLAFERYIMSENSGTSYSNLALRPYHHEIVRQMDEAALAGGYGTDTAESDAERIFWGPELEPIRNKLWVGRPRIYAAVYCYARYHTLISASEVGWEESGLLRYRRLFEIGNELWPSEYYPGYATRVILANTHAAVTAYGQTASARRASRIELWNRLPQMTMGMLDPVAEGKCAVVCATSAAAGQKYLADPKLRAVLESLRSHPGADLNPVRQFSAGWPAGQNHPEAWFSLTRGDAGARQGAAPVRNGLCLRLRLPYQRAQIQDLRLNGRPVPASEVNGFVSWAARGCTYIQVNIAPETARPEDFFLVTCDYDPCEKRRRWDIASRL